MPTLEQNGQVRSSRSYLDNLAAGSGLETPAGLSLEENLNAVRSQLKRIMDPVGATKWYQDMAAAGFDSFGLKQIHDKAFVFRSPITPGTNDFTLGASASGVLVDASLLVGGSGVIAVGPSSSTEGGYVAADEANFTVAGTLGVGLSTAKDGDGVLLNKVDVIDDATNEPPSDGGVTVMGLLQTVTGTGDGSAVAAAASENLQISFFKIDPGTDLITAVSLPAGTYHFGLPRQRSLYTLARGAIMSGVDALPDAIGPSTADLRLPFRHFDLVGAIAALDPLNIQTGVFTTAGAQTVFASFGTPILPATGAAFRDDSRVKVWRNGNLQSKGAVAGDSKDIHWISTTQIAFKRVLNPTEEIVLESPASF
jgi:hypothetical protein